MRANFGNSRFLNSLFRDTLQSLADRVDPVTGFCETCFREIGDHDHYARTHFPKDSSECAEILAMVDNEELAERIMDFNFRSIPLFGQDYLPHQVERDGRIHSNYVQLDTQAKALIALHAMWEMHDDFTIFYRYFYSIQKMVYMFERYFDHKYNLFRAGNYNEQHGGIEGEILDLYTNCVMLSGLRKIAEVLEECREGKLADHCLRYADLAKRGMEENLKIDGRYTTGIYRESGRFLEYISPYNTFFPLKWYPDCDKEAEKATYEHFKETLTVNWDGVEVMMSSHDKSGIIGKCFAHTMGYCASTGRLSELDNAFKFLEHTVRKPHNSYPEGWWYDWMKAPMERFNVILSTHPAHFYPWKVDPEQDYTINSGNTEQASNWVFHILTEVINIRKTGESSIVAAPAIPLSWEEFQAKDLYIGKLGDKKVHVNFSLRREVEQTSISIDTGEYHGDIGAELHIPVRSPGKVFADGREVPAKLSAFGEANHLSFDLAMCGKPVSIKIV